MRRLHTVSIIAAVCLIAVTYGITRALDDRPTIDQVNDRRDTVVLHPACRHGAPHRSHAPTARPHDTRRPQWATSTATASQARGASS